IRRHPGARLHVATKVPPKDGRWPGRAETPAGEASPYAHILEMTRKSLANLGQERLDLQQLHVWSDAWADDDGWRRAAQDLKSQGLGEGVGRRVSTRGTG